jgi:hypothetical protein
MRQKRNLLERAMPFDLVRDGRYVMVRSRMAPEEHSVWIAAIRARRPRIKAAIDSRIASLRRFLSDWNPIDILKFAAFRWSFYNPEIPDSERRVPTEPCMEYVLSLAVSVACPKFDNFATAEAVQVFLHRVEKLFFWVQHYYESEGAEENCDPAEGMIRYAALSWHTFVRGSAYATHQSELASRLLDPHNDFFQKRLGFLSSDLVQASDTVLASITSSVEDARAVFADLAKLHSEYLEFTVSERPENQEAREALMHSFRSLPGKENAARELGERWDRIDWDVFKIPAGPGLPQSLLSALSCKFGDNEPFMEVRYAGWPANDTVVTRRPFICHAGEYYCFLPALLHRHIIRIGESLIRENDDSYFETRYHGTRHRVVNELTLEYIRSMLPAAVVTSNVHYTQVGPDGQKCESDGLVMYDDILIAVETKAGVHHVQARRGGLKAIRTDAKSLVQEAYDQGERLMRYVQSTDPAVFSDNRNNELLRLTASDRPAKRYILNVTLEDLGMLATRVASSSELGLGQREVPMWTVNINDLRVVSELMEFPSEFVHYLDRRAHADEYTQVRTPDELDVLMYFLRKGLDFDTKSLKEFTSFSMVGFTEELDRYYDWLDGQVETGHRPTLQIPASIKELCRRIEQTEQRGFTDATNMLLGFGHDNLVRLAEAVNKLRVRLASDGKPHDVRAATRTYGMTIATSRERTPAVVGEFRKMCYIQMHTAGLPRWLLAHLHAPPSGAERISWELLRADDVPEEALARASALLASNRRRRHPKLGRNEPCPCGSGRKYKQCCGRP